MRICILQVDRSDGSSLLKRGLALCVVYDPGISSPLYMAIFDIKIWEDKVSSKWWLQGKAQSIIRRWDRADNLPS